MNRKEGIIVGAILLTTFVGGVFAAPSIQNIMILNDPLNVRVIGPPPATQTTSVDIEVLKMVPGINTPFTYGAIPVGVWVYTGVNFTTAFAFSSAGSSVQLNQVVLTLVYSATSNVPSPSLNIRLNGQLSGSITLMVPGNPVAATITLPGQNIRQGANVLELSVNAVFQVFVTEVRLTVEYSFMA